MTSDSSAMPLRPRRRLPAPARAVLVVGALYGFLVGVALLESGIAAMGEGFQEGLLASVRNPIAGVCAGLLFTVLVQSSSVSTSAIVGLVGAGTVPVSLAVPMIMGANIGTTITNTLASLGAIRRTEEFQRGFAAATVHDFFNILAVVVLLPVELLTGVITRVAAWLTGILRGREVDLEPGRSPLREAVRLPVDWIAELVEGPLIGRLAGALFLALGLALIFLALAAITKNMRTLVADSVERAMNRIVGRGGGAVGVVVGILVTFAVQSSTITTSILVPLVAAGILTLPNAYPITLGANVGTTITALLASLAVVHPEGLTIALVHMLFNLVALALLFPVRAVRLLPVHAAEWMAATAVERRSVVAVYVVGLFLVIPVAGVVLLR